MKKLITILCLACSLLGVSAPAESLKITRSSATELYLALSSIDAGLSPANTVAAADNLNVLRPHVEALDKGKTAYQRALRAAAKAQGADLDLQVDKLNAEIEAVAAVEITVDLAPLSLSDDEIASAKVKPATLATVRRWLLKKK